MKTENKQIDQLTRALMKNAIEKPSTPLVGSIMERIAKEGKASRKQKPSLSWLPAVSWMAGGLLIYFLLSVGVGYILLSQSTEAAGLAGILQTLFPLISAGLGGASLFFFFTQLDTWLRWKQSKN